MHDVLSPQQITGFWAWLTSHQSDLNVLTAPDEPFWRVLQERIKQLHPGLSFELTVPDEEGRELIITAQGDWRLFPLVESLVSSAPEVPGWTFVALKPAMGFDFNIRYQGLDLEPNDIWFQPLSSKETPEMLGLRVAVPAFSEDRAEDFRDGLWLLLDNALGEKSTGMDVDLADVCELPDDPRDEGFLPLKELGKYLAWRKARMAQKHS